MLKNSLKWLPVRCFVLIIAVVACNAKKENNDGLISLNEIEDIKTRQYAIEGQLLYANYCANCHQKDGAGLGKLIPPLQNADFMLADTGRTIRLIKHGIKGEITVNGVNYNQPMPGNPQLTNLEIAEIATYIYTVFGGHEKRVEASEVKKNLETTKETD
ncbi:cytochrome c [Echinicola strongylocentroti]|uniref:Cytochrome c n=1 Tax=Echinicola strongylocentroti TaxID=1795355 RepID=A0A2Z4IG00_9BACT|nr:cytochrome c [Echinicola strongylocentroti]AWW29815.1 cytochrome c [Echinicola strongylocentroti]